MLSSLLFLSFLVSLTSSQCPYSYPTPGCSTNTLFVLDATNYLTNTDINCVGLDCIALLTYLQELNFTMNSLLPYFGIPMQEATIVTYGSGSQFTPLTSIYSIACAQLNNLIQDVNTHGGQRATLTS